MRYPISRSARMVCALLSASLLASCGGDSDGDTPQSLVIDGTWVSSADPAVRNRFAFNGTVVIQGYDATLEGNLQFWDASGAQQVNEAVSGEGDQEGLDSNPYWSFSFATADSTVSFSSALYDALASTSPMTGQFRNSRGASLLEGDWHNLVAGGPVDVKVDGACATTYTLHDLTWNGTSLLAVATPAGGSAGVYSVATSAGSATLTAVSPTPTPADPKGIAWDATQGRYWVVSPDHPGPDQFTLNAYDTTWSSAGAPVTGDYVMGDGPGSVAFRDGKLWFASFFGAPFAPRPYTIDPANGSVTMSATGPELSRTTGFDFAGDDWWVASMPAGGVWGKLTRYLADGSFAAVYFAPEAGGASCVACEGNHFVWVASGDHLVRLDVR